MKKRFTLFSALAVTLVLIFGITTCKTSSEPNQNWSLTGLEIKSVANTAYTAGDFFNMNDIVVTATYRDKEPVNVTAQCSFEPSLRTPLGIGDTDITISYTEDDFTLKAKHGITVVDSGVVAVTQVTISTPLSVVPKGSTQQFSANVAGVNAPQTVTWTVEGGIAAGTGISGTGLLTVASDETALFLIVTAASAAQGYTHISDTGTVIITEGGEGIAVSQVTVTPPVASVAKGSTQQFSANVAGAHAPQTVTWTVEGGASGTSISSTGLLSVAAGETASSLTVRARTTAPGYTYISGTSTITVTDGGTSPVVVVTNVRVNPGTPLVQKGSTQQFGVYVEGTGNPSQDVTWTVEGGSAAGTDISIGGLLTVAAGETASTLTVKATSVTDTAKYGTATVTVTGGGSQGGTLVVEPATIHIANPNLTQQFTATINGVAHDVTWSTDSIYGQWTTINSSGFLSIWGGCGEDAFIVTATSKSNPQLTGTATVTFKW